MKMDVDELVIVRGDTCVSRSLHGTAGFYQRGFFLSFKLILGVWLNWCSVIYFIFIFSRFS